MSFMKRLAQMAFGNKDHDSLPVAAGGNPLAVETFIVHQLVKQGWADAGGTIVLPAEAKRKDLRIGEATITHFQHLHQFLIKRDVGWAGVTHVQTLWIKDGSTVHDLVGPDFSFTQVQALALKLAVQQMDEDLPKDEETV